MQPDKERLEKVALTLAGITTWDDLQTPPAQHDIERYRMGMVAYYCQLAARAWEAYNTNRAIPSPEQAAIKWDPITKKRIT